MNESKLVMKLWFKIPSAKLIKFYQYLKILLFLVDFRWSLVRLSVMCWELDLGLHLATFTNLEYWSLILGKQVAVPRLEIANFLIGLFCTLAPLCTYQIFVKGDGWCFICGESNDWPIKFICSSRYFYS